MRWPTYLFITLAMLAATAAAAQSTVYVSPDVPTEPDSPASFLPWEVVRHSTPSAFPYSLQFGVPGSPAIDALEKADLPDHWLFSVEAPSDLGGALGGAYAQPEDVIGVDVASALYSFFMDGSCVTGAVPPGSSIDALYLDGGDLGDLIVSFDRPTTILGTTYQPSQLVRYSRTTGPPCGWSLVGLPEIDFATKLGVYSPGSINVTGADRVGTEWILAFDIPAEVGPPVQTFTPGQIVASDGVTVSAGPVVDLQGSGTPGWPISSLVDALACEANPGAVYDAAVLPVGLTVGKAAAGDITLFWPGGSCSSGAEDYGVYEGSLASIGGGVYDHVGIVCTDPAPFLEETLTPAVASSYYIVVPHNAKVEGSHGTDSSGSQRPQPGLPADRCVVDRVVTACP